MRKKICRQCTPCMYIPVPSGIQSTFEMQLLLQPEQLVNILVLNNVPFKTM